MPPSHEDTLPPHAVATALEAYRRGYTPLPIKARAKMPGTPGWTRLSYESEAEVREKFSEWSADGHVNVGVLLGEKSSNLVDIDLDHPRTARLKRHFLPPTGMITGRPGRPASHYWYKVVGHLPSNRRHKMPDGSMAVELRSNGSQTLLPPSIHPSGEQYTWDAQEWGEPAEIDGDTLAAQVALLGLGTVLIDTWPEQGSRHEAFLALAGGTLRNIDGSVHPFWEKNLPVLITALADATNDEDGGESRVSEVMGTTLKRIKTGGMVAGFGKLGDILGAATVKQVRTLIREVESAAGYEPRESVRVEHSSDSGSLDDRKALLQDEVGGLEPEERDPLSERVVTWQPVDLDPYLTGRVRLEPPDVLTRSDGQSLMYRGRVNMLFGSSESAKSWIALHACLQEMGQGKRVVYIDLEDEPINTLDRLQRLGAGHDDIRLQFNYIRPEEPLAPMQKNKWGQLNITERGKDNYEMFNAALEEIDPTVIVADGMTVLYGLHGLDANDAVSTDIITGWLKTLTRNGRSTVILIDHTAKGGQKGGTPIGSQHKTAMAQGTILQVWPVTQPMPGRVGEVELIVVKDRPGMVRQFALEPKGERQAQVAATVILDSTQGDHSTMRIEPPKEVPGVLPLENSKAAEKAMAAREWEERVKHVYGGELGKALSMAEIVEELKANDAGVAEIKAAVARLLDQGWLEMIGKTKGTKYRLVVGDAGYDDLSEKDKESASE